MPVMPTVKLRAHPGELSEVKIPEGTLEVRFRPRGDAGTTEGARASGSDVGRRAGGRDTRFKQRAERFLKLGQEAIDTRLQIMRLEDDLKACEAGMEIGAEGERPGSKERDEALEQRIVDVFLRDPEAIALVDEIAEATEQRDRARRMTRRADDPVRVVAELRLEKLMNQYKTLWEFQYEQIRHRLASVSETITVPEAATALRKKLESLKELQAKQTKMLAEFKIDDDGKE